MRLVRPDQAATLRKLRNSDTTSIVPRKNRSMAVTGGKGGVGKSAIAANLAVLCGAMKSRTLLVDGDVGMADLNLLLGVAPQHSLLDVVKGLPVEQALVEAHGVKLLPALNGGFQLEIQTGEERHRTFDLIDRLAPCFDSMVVDVGAGLGPNQIELAAYLPTVIVVVTSDPLSLADTYATLKVLHRVYHLKRAFLLPNRVRNVQEGQELAARLVALVSQFLDLELVALPGIPLDSRMTESCAEGIPTVLAHPDAPASRALKQALRTLDALMGDDQPKERFFTHRMKQRMETTL